MMELFDYALLSTPLGLKRFPPNTQLLHHSILDRSFSSVPLRAS
jgi:hypothetical protein